MTTMRIRKAPSKTSIVACFAIALIAAFAVGLGFWQLDRAHQKEHAQQLIDTAAKHPPLILGATLLNLKNIEFRHLIAQGEWLPAKAILIDNKVHDGRAGYDVIMPLSIAGSPYPILVNRGWIAAPRLRSELPKIPHSSGSVTVEGLARIPHAGFILSSNSRSPTGIVWQNLTIDRYQSWSGLNIQPLLIEQTNATDDGLVHEHYATRFDGWNGPARNYAYAIQWFALAAILLILSFLYIFRRKTT